MSVVSGDNIVGYIASTSKNFSIAISIYSADFRTSGTTKNSNNTCLIKWNGIETDKMIFEEMSIYKEVNIGDTIITTGFSTLFPPGLNIGKVSDIDKDVNNTHINGAIRPMIDISSLKYVTILEHKFIKERRTLEEELNVINTFLPED